MLNYIIEIIKARCRDVLQYAPATKNWINLMNLAKDSKDAIKYEIIQNLKPEKEINKIVIFGSFLESEEPNDIDIAIYQDSEESYLFLAMKYRKLIRKIAKKIPIDIIPLKSNASNNSFLSEIEAGEIIYER